MFLSILCSNTGGGSISPLEFAKTLKQVGKIHAPNKEIQRQNKKDKRGSWFDSPFSIFQIIDSDHSGEIDEKEFTDYVMSGQSKREFRELLLAVVALDEVVKKEQSKKPSKESSK